MRPGKGNRNNGVRPHRRSCMNLPNKITIARIVLTFIFMLFLFSKGLGAKVTALLLFLAAAFTDYLDGYLARKLDIKSDFGRIMDPLADKLLTLAAFLAFVEMKLIPAWMVVVIIFRELLITSIRLKALTRGDVLSAGRGGKHKTASQMLSIFIILVFIVIREAGVRVFGFWGPAMELWYRQIIYVMMFITVVLTVISGTSYIFMNKRYLLNGGKGE
ncbi:MAG: CDP-diacylglycerol--glycerol-3-phosphate 3-phosphatidyltransferase [Candidatus Omnitrophica bacterium]|nr:CDP-diacylglycerol--glycerol-3-phosphate 3-phosphatidyltransferase [Candidatus Omnitrophota bacterium]